MYAGAKNTKDWAANRTSGAAPAALAPARSVKNA